LLIFFFISVAKVGKNIGFYCLKNEFFPKNTSCKVQLKTVPVKYPGFFDAKHENRKPELVLICHICLK